MIPHYNRYSKATGMLVRNYGKPPRGCVIPDVIDATPKHAKADDNYKGGTIRNLYQKRKATP